MTATRPTRPIPCATPATAASPVAGDPVELELVLEGVHVRQKPSYGTASSSRCSIRRCERLDDQLLAGVHVVEDLRRSTKKPALIRTGDVATVLEPGDVAVVVGVDDVERVRQRAR